MDEDFIQLYRVIIIVCLIIITVHVCSNSSNSSYFSDTLKATLPFASERDDRFVGSGGVEPPVFYNLGSVSQIDDALKKASQDGSDTFVDPHLQKLKKVGEFFDPHGHVSKLKGVTAFENH